jgi:membrane-associated phospholipid phosphatase
VKPAAAGLLSLALLADSAPAAAQGLGPAAPDWAFGSPGGEAAVAAVCAASLAAYLIPQRRSGWGPDGSRPLDPTLDLISDFTGAGVGSLLVTGQAYLFEGGYLAQQGAADPFARALRTSLIDAEAVTLAAGITFAVKRLTGRCRPRAHHGGRCDGADSDVDAFPSGHTAPVAAIAGVHLSLAARTPGDAGLRLGALGVAEAATLITMALRVGAGAHSWEDVGAGFILGHVAGVALGYAHPMVTLDPRRSPGAPGAPAPAGTALSWSGTF